MRSTTRRTTLRTAAVFAGAAAVLALPVGSAFADSPAGPEQEVLPGVERPAGEQPAGERPVEEKPGGEKPVTGPAVDPAVPAVDPSVPQVDPTAPPVKRAFVTTVRLADGSIAKIYKIGDGHFEAVVFSGSTKLDTLVTKGGKPAYGQNNGLHVVLQPNGTVTSWVEGEPAPKPKPEPKPEPKPLGKPKHEVREGKKESSVRITMPDGRIAKLVDGPNGKRVEISMPNGNRLGTIDLKHPVAQNDGWTYRIVQDGKRVKFVVIDGKGGGNSWVYGFDGKLIEKYVAERPKPAKPAQPAVERADRVERVVPKGGVKAGAEGVGTAAGSSKGDTPMLVAAGGGMAAAGAAGLGFALLKRGRADQS
ncbi:hypothetical protein [Streptomyces sp. NPDC051704]|uniref:hypothetical protein n=1 Tax=Streptomyces sp. NPDC051704 TaxID=3365671 RepID=UPI00378D2BD2